jgi:high affinity Mn2+ porin
MSLHSLIIGTAVLSIALPCASFADAPADPAAEALSGAPAPQSYWPRLIGEQYTFVLQHQSALHSPYAGPLSLKPDGDTQPTHTIGFYLGWALTDWAQLYFDTEKFMGAWVSDATGLGGLTNGDVVREGANNLPKRFYIARSYLRFMLPLGPELTKVAAGQDQIAGTEAAQRLEFKVGWLAVNDDFDKNRYAGSTRTEFMNWSLRNNTAWDYAADTRGYTAGFVLGYISPLWSLKYGMYRMPVRANGQELEASLWRAQGDNLELTLSPSQVSTVVRLLAYRNTARMGIYSQTLAIAAAEDATPNIVADDRDGRKKYGFGINAEQPLADNGATGVFARFGWNDGKTESFAFTEVDRLASIGGEVSGSHWQRADDVAGIAVADEGLSAWHREYLAAGGLGFLLGDGRLDYAHEEILETYYRLQLPWQWAHVQLSPDYQFIRNPGFNAARGPVSFWAIRFHIEH